MKRLLLLLTAGVGVAVAFGWMQSQSAKRSAHELETQRAAWEAEKAGLQAALEKEKARVRTAAPARTVVTGEPAPAATQPDPQELLKKLVALKGSTGPGQTRVLRQVLSLLGQLAEAGPAALPAIREFLATGQDAVFDTSVSKGLREVSVLAGALVPATLRFGLFDVVRQIGGEEAETILASALGQTGRAVEVAYLAHLLEEMAPGKFRDTALSVAKSLLAQNASGPDRDYLFSVLKRFGDESYVATAQAQLIQTDGKVDRSALRYLQQTLGEKSVALAAQTYADPRVTEADSKESLARIALAYVGANDQAMELFHAAVLDPALKPKQRRELAEDLNQDGIANEKSPTDADLKIIANRFALTEAYLQTDYVQNDKVLDAGFKEANKDLKNMLQRAAATNSAR